MYGAEDYYWYLRSPEFQKTFLVHLGAAIDRYGKSCLDIGCGQGYLARYTHARYVGFDGSSTAIDYARHQNLTPNATFIVLRFEDFATVQLRLQDDYDVIVFGNILWHITRPENHIEFIEAYQQQFNSKYLAVYDMETLDTLAIDKRFERVEEYHASVTLKNLQEVKRHRKILVYRCP